MKGAETIFRCWALGIFFYVFIFICEHLLNFQVYKILSGSWGAKEMAEEGDDGKSSRRGCALILVCNSLYFTTSNVCFTNRLRIGPQP
jgi:hypothetical protein